MQSWQCIFFVLDSQDCISDLANVSNAESETDLMALCSGKFVTQPPKPKDLEDDSEQLPDSQLSPTQPVTLDNEDSVVRRQLS